MAQKKSIVIIGAGPAGYTAAFLAADLGMEVTLVDENPRPGGVCLYRGCMPSKALLHIARTLNEADQARNWGIDFGEPSIDLDRLRNWKEQVVSRLTGGLSQLSDQRSIDYVCGRASFVNAQTISVVRADQNTQTINFDSAILATGSRPAYPVAFPMNSERILDSTTALELRSIPKTLLVIGGGYIGLELGSVYAALGTKVTVVEMTDGLLPGADRDLVSVLSRQLRKQIGDIHLRTKVGQVKTGANGVEVSLDGPETRGEVLVFDSVLVAVGRIPNSDIPGLEQTQIECDERGFIKVDQHRRTAEPSIFAVGDLVGEPMLAHKAFHESRVAVETIAGQSAVFEPAAIPAVVFTDPELAWCGLTETQAKREGREIRTARFPWAASGRAVTLDRTDGATKLVLDRETDQILGVGIVGTGAGELIAEAVIAIEMGATVEDLKLSIHPHPTLSETMLEAAEVSLGLSTHVYRPSQRTEK
tara:strand:- start:1221 stop:2648 length:1428 start_codon:yes stop_codon:yes gene_type:complete